MQNMFYDFIPIVIFFLAFKFYGIYVATVVGIAVTAVQVLITRAVQKRFDNKQLITLGVFIFFGGMTLYFHDPIFVKWKPTIIYWVFAVILLTSKFVTQKPLLERLFDGVKAEGNLNVPKAVWQRLTYAWTAFFFILGWINIYVAYSFSTETWVNFKLFGVLVLSLVFVVAQAVYLARYFSEQK